VSEFSETRITDPVSTPVCAPLSDNISDANGPGGISSLLLLPEVDLLNSDPRSFRHSKCFDTDPQNLNAKPDVGQDPYFRLGAELAPQETRRALATILNPGAELSLHRSDVIRLPSFACQGFQRDALSLNATVFQKVATANENGATTNAVCR